MATPKRVREQVVVYLEPGDRDLLEKLASTTGLARTELFRRGLWALAAKSPSAGSPSAFEQLIAGAADFDAPADYAEHADEYLYGGKPLHRQVAEKSSTPKKRGKRARPR